MIHFNLNIDLFYDFELMSGSEIKAISCIEYPVLHIIAKTIETVEEDYDELDKFIVRTALKCQGIRTEQLAELTGVNRNIFVYRAEELEKQQYIIFANDIIQIKDKGNKFVNDTTFERQIERTRSFLLDGSTHKPLKSFFYNEGKSSLISEEEKDAFGYKLFNPAVIHSPPTRYTNQNILDIPINERVDYNIPVGLKEIIDYDFVLMTFPIAIVMARSKSGEIRKKLYDLNGFYADEKPLNTWQKLIEHEISKVEITIEEKVSVKNDQRNSKIHFRNNWPNTNSVTDNRIFNFSIEKAKPFIQRLFNLSSIDDNSIELNDYSIKINIDKKLFETKDADRKKIIESCQRKRDYIRQYEGTGVWLIFLEIIIADSFIQRLVNLHKLFKDNLPIETILSINTNFKLLRQDIISLGRYDKLEELDIYLFLHSRESNYSQIYLTLENE